jgi:hypothetical protein
LIKQRFPFQTTKYGPAGKRLFVNIRWAKSNDRSGPRRTIELTAAKTFCGDVATNGSLKQDGRSALTFDFRKPRSALQSLACWRLLKIAEIEGVVTNLG